MKLFAHANDAPRADSIHFRSHAGRRVGLFLAWLCIAAPTACAERLPRAVLPSGVHFGLEIAVDDEARQRGYMFRERVGPNEGMLFIFDAPARHGFWMKNCKVNLDIIWMDAAYRVVDIAHNVPPCPEIGDCLSVLPRGEALYVLEIAGGTAIREGLRSGDRIAVELEPR